jgi:cellulose synthase/poly-beta-1,6-N-acetylglucosamine synthase-like glycosyltransferase
MKISYAITVCDEFVEIQRLIPFLLENKKYGDEIVVLYDSKNGDEKVEEFLRAKSINSEFSWHKDKFNNHFADWKNKLTEKCDGDWIFQIDADEIPHIDLITYLPEIILSNPKNEVIKVPRINTVHGLTEEYERKWGWRVNEKGWVNWPDFQWRIWKNHHKIKWVNKVHELLDGYSTYSDLNQ